MFPKYPRNFIAYTEDMDMESDMRLTSHGSSTYALYCLIVLSFGSLIFVEIHKQSSIYVYIITMFKPILYTW